jgi:hypothetical protein
LQFRPIVVIFAPAPDVKHRAFGFAAYSGLIGPDWAVNLFAGKDHCNV